MVGGLLEVCWRGEAGLRALCRSGGDTWGASGSPGRLQPLLEEVLELTGRTSPSHRNGSVTRPRRPLHHDLCL